jgi:DNA-binding transcriptional regulator YhcF (GntR family)
MQFRLEKDSPIPIGTQIKERIRIGLSLGDLRAGDTLPSIRDLEAATGIGRAIIRKAYVALRDEGVLEIRHGRRVTVSDSVLSRTNEDGLRERLDQLLQETLQKAAKLRLNEVSFARYLLSRAMEQSRQNHLLMFVDRSQNVANAAAATISGLWDIPVAPVSFAELPNLLRSSSGTARKMLTNYYRLDQVTSLVRELGLSKKVSIIPTGWFMSEAMKNRVREVDEGSRILLIAEEDDFKKDGQSFAEAYEKEFADRRLNFLVVPARGENTVDAGLRSSKYALVIVSSTIWDRLPAPLKKNAKLMRPSFDLNKSTLEEARIKVGILQ